MQKQYFTFLKIAKDLFQKTQGTQFPAVHNSISNTEELEATEKELIQQENKIDLKPKFKKLY